MLVINSVQEEAVLTKYLGRKGLSKKITHFGHVRPTPMTPGPPRNNFNYKTFYLRHIQYFNILINTLYIFFFKFN